MGFGGFIYMLSALGLFATDRNFSVAVGELGKSKLRLSTGSGQALGVLTVRASLCGRAMAFITPNALRKLCSDRSQVFLGFGFEWQPVHSQRLYELAKVNFRDFMVSPWLLRFLGHVVHLHETDVHAWPFAPQVLIVLGAGLLLGAAGSGLTIRRFLQI